MNFVTLIILFFLIGCQNSQNESIADICPDSIFSQHVSTVSLKDPDEIKRLNGSFIEVDGIFHHDFEDVALYHPDKDARSALWLSLKIPDSLRGDRLEKMNGKEVTLIGRVNMSRKGHLGAYFGTLDSVFCIKMKR